MFKICVWVQILLDSPFSCANLLPPMASRSEDLFTTTQAAEKTGVPLRTVQDRVDKERIPVELIGGAAFFHCRPLHLLKKTAARGGARKRKTKTKRHTARARAKRSAIK